MSQFYPNLASTATSLLSRFGETVVFSHFTGSFDATLGAREENYNKCSNYNANPDEALTGMTIDGIPFGTTFQRVQDVAKLAAVGADLYCLEGNVFFLDNRLGTSWGVCVISGEMGNLNPHSLGVLARKTAGGGNPFISNSTWAWPLTYVTTEDYVQYSIENESPASTADKISIACSPGQGVYFILNQLVENTVLGPVAITAGAPNGDLSVPYYGTVVKLDYTAKEIDGTVIQAGDVKLLCNAIASPPAIDDKVALDGASYRIVNVTSLRPADTTVLYVLQVRK